LFGDYSGRGDAEHDQVMTIAGVMNDRNREVPDQDLPKTIIRLPQPGPTGLAPSSKA
jgi:hypothetical protein